MYVNNLSGTAPEDFDRKTAGRRIGRRIYAIRQEQGMSRVELGEKIGLNSNRVQQYENGERTPKFELCKRIAEALEVETSAILDPQVTSYIGAMYAFFEMEKLYDLRLKEVDGQMCICFGKEPYDTNVRAINENLKMWDERKKQLEMDISNAKSEENKEKLNLEYHMWEWNFPHSTDTDAMSKSERVAKEREAHKLE